MRPGKEMDFIHDVCTRAMELRRRLVLPEGTESRTRKATRILIDDGLVRSVAADACGPFLRALQNP